MLGEFIFTDPCKVTDIIFILHEIEAQKGEVTRPRSHREF